MANYGLYTSIDVNTLKKNASNIKSQIPSNKSALSSHKGTLTDDIWKAGAKTTLTTAYDKIESEVYQELEDALTNIETVCGYISQYKTAEENAKTLIDSINSAAKDVDTSGLQQQLIDQENQMNQAENAVNGLCGG